MILLLKFSVWGPNGAYVLSEPVGARGMAPWPPLDPPMWGARAICNPILSMQCHRVNHRWRSRGVGGTGPGQKFGFLPRENRINVNKYILEWCYVYSGLVSTKTTRKPVSSVFFAP